MRRIFRVARLALVVTMVFSMTIGSANACRLFHRMFTHHQVQYCAPVVPMPHGCSQIIVDDCCGEIVHESNVVIHEGETHHQHDVVPNEPTLADPVVDAGGNDMDVTPSSGGYGAGSDSGYGDAAPVDHGDGHLFDPPTLDETPATGLDPLQGDVPTDAGALDAPADAGDDLFDAPADDVAPADAGDDLFDAPADDVAPADAGDDLFDAPADDVAPADAGDDLFDAPADDVAPADAGDDLFDAPADDVAPADAGDDLFDAPADDVAPADAGDDLFDAPADDVAPADAGDDLFDAPADDVAPADAGDDLFDAPADDVAPADAGDDLFDAPADDVAPADAGDDLFDAPADDVAPADAGDDLFDAPADDVVPADAGDDLFDAPADEGADDLFDEPAGDDEADDLFGRRPASSETKVAARLAKPTWKANARGMRTWKDDTGQFKTVGRLVVIAKTHIRLLKENGRYSTVPLVRLSEQDLDYVMAVAKKLVGSQRLASR